MLSARERNAAEDHHKEMKSELSFISEKFGGPSNLKIYPKIANPFNEKRGFKIHSNKPGGGAYNIDCKNILTASINLDNVKRAPLVPHNYRTERT